jgi:hypothetical protein
LDGNSTSPINSDIYERKTWLMVRPT